MKKLITPKQAAKIIGCSTTQVRHLIRKGGIKARREQTDTNQTGYRYRYLISVAEAERYRDTPQTRGWPRGLSYEYDS